MSGTTTRPRRYAGPGLINGVRLIFFALAVIAVAAGVISWISGLSEDAVMAQGQIGDAISVPVTDPQTGAPLSPAERSRLLEDRGITIDVWSGSIAHAEITDASSGGQTDLRTITRLLWRSNDLILGIACGAGALLLGLLAEAIGGGRPFDRRNPRRIALAGLCVLVATVLAPLLSGLASRAALSDAGLADWSPLHVELPDPLIGVFATVAILVLAQAFRAGTQVTEDVEGLV